MKITKRFFIYLVSVFVLGFIFNYIWESLHYSLYVCKTPLGKCSLITSLIDALIVSGIYFIFVLLYKDECWICKFNKNKVLLLIGFSFLIALIIEIQGVYLFNRWDYNSLMPTIFGIGLSPLLQMMILPLVIFYFVGRAIIFMTKRFK